MKQLSSVMLLVVAVGCGGGNSRPPVVDDDDGGDDIDAPPSANCLVSDDLGTVTPTQQVAEFSNDMATPPAPATFFWIGDINADAAQDLIALELYAGFGIFASGFPAGATTVQITGAETNYETCGACIRVLADVSEEGVQSADYVATSGSIAFTEISSTRIAGTITGVTLTHVDILPEAPFTSTPNPDGCESQLGTLAFDAVPTLAMAKKGGRPVTAMKLDPSTIRFYRK
jgi:hypothetical protein